MTYFKGIFTLSIVIDDNLENLWYKIITPDCGTKERRNKEWKNVMLLVVNCPPNIEHLIFPD